MVNIYFLSLIFLWCRVFKINDFWDLNVVYNKMFLKLNLFIILVIVLDEIGLKLNFFVFK